MRAGKKRSVGLSICSQKIAMVDVNIGFSGNMEVTHLAIADIPTDAIINGSIDNPEIIAEQIREILAINDIKAIKRISLSIEDNLTNTRLMTMPSLLDGDMQESLISKVGDYAILAGNKPSLDFHIVRRYNSGPAERMDVLFVVAPEQTVNTFLSIMESANTNLMSLETIPLAIIRAYLEFIQSDQSRQNIMLVIIEENHGMIVILQNETVKFVHDIEVGRKELEATNDIADVLSEIRSSLDYYKKIFPLEADVEEIVLFSDSIEDFNVGENLRANLNIEINEPQLPFDIIARFGDQVKDNVLSIFAAIGSAGHDLAGKEDIAINLVPGKKEAKISHVRTRITALALALVSVVLVLIIGSVIIRYKTRTIEDNIIQLKEQAILEIPNPTELLVANQMAQPSNNAVNAATKKAVMPILDSMEKSAPKGSKLASLANEPDKKATVASGSRRSSTKQQGGIYSIRIGVFSSKKNADKAIALMKSKNYNPWIKYKTSKRQTTRQVFIGRFRTEKEADQFGELMKKDLPWLSGYVIQKTK
jgi:Tfp pilus assembly PilM family ATPase/cell division septation protein DedD